MLEDIAILTAGEVITDSLERRRWLDISLKLEDTQLSSLGRAHRVVVTKDTTTIIDGLGDTEAIQFRTNQIKNEIENTDSDFDREKLQERLAKLSGGGVAVVKVGAATDSARKLKKQLVEDALGATRAALQEGVVAGGGVALWAAAETIEPSSYNIPDERTGAEIVRQALARPLRQILENAGYEPETVIEQLRTAGPGYVLDVASRSLRGPTDPVAPVDAAAVLRLAFTKAISAATNVLKTNHALGAWVSNTQSHYRGSESRSAAIRAITADDLIP